MDSEIKGVNVQQLSFVNESYLDFDELWKLRPDKVQVICTYGKRIVLPRRNVGYGKKYKCFSRYNKKAEIPLIIRELVEEAFKCIGKIITWEGKGINEVGIDQDHKVRVIINEKLYRPTEVPHLCGDYSKIKKELGWEPKTKFQNLTKKMVANDLILIKN